MRWTQRRKRLRELVSGDRCYHPASVFDPISARIAQDLGFEMTMFAGSVASLTVLGAPDHIVLTLSEFAAQGARICRSSEVPLVVDADHGYGNALNVMRCVEELEAAGISALTIEDTALPMAYGSNQSTQLLSLAEGVGKMRAALAARVDPNLMIIGRTSAFGVTDEQDALLRAKAYEAAGVDALFMLGLKNHQQIELLKSEINIPLMVAGFSDLEFLGSQGVRICLQGHHPVKASIKAVYDTLKALRSGTPPGEIENLASVDLMKKVTRDADYQRWIKDFL
jgi:oxaloacetate decarboxylase